MRINSTPTESCGRRLRKQSLCPIQKAAALYGQGSGLLCYEDFTILFCLFLPEDDQLGNDVVQNDHHDLRGKFDPEFRESEPCDEHGDDDLLASEGEQPSAQKRPELPRGSWLSF